MRTAIKETKVFTYDELSDSAKEKALCDWIQSESEFFWWDEIQETIKAFADAFNVTVRDYELSGSSYGRSYFRIDYTDPAEYHGEDCMSGIRVWKYINNHYGHLLTGNCPLTGVCYDEDMLDPFREFIKNPDQSTTLHDLIKDAFNSIISSVQSEIEYSESEEAFMEYIEANEVEFTKSGKVYYE